MRTVLVMVMVPESDWEKQGVLGLELVEAFWNEFYC